jgi:hypothetical protein
LLFAEENKVGGGQVGEFAATGKQEDGFFERRGWCLGEGYRRGNWRWRGRVWSCGRSCGAGPQTTPSTCHFEDMVEGSEVRRQLQLQYVRS